jgi:UDPglucose 6-dehydrogenase
MNVTIIGTGFVGVVTTAVFASFGNKVYGLDIDENRVASLKQGKVPFYEPQLEDLLVEQQKTGNLTFTTDYAEAISNAEVIMIAVGTPSAADGQADLKFVNSAIDSLATHLQPNTIVVIKSTVPPGTLPTLSDRIKARTQVPFYMASLPEFLREGSAVTDTLHPDRIVIGADEPVVFEKLSQLHQPLGAPIVKVKPSSAQMAKYTSNAYLATRISFINQIADLCEHNEADIQEVIEAIGYDKRIGKHYWYPGFGYGGSCFPKDVSELAAYSRSVGEDNNLFNKLHELNTHRIDRLMEKFSLETGGWDNKTVAVLGLSFKPNTDDMREAPSIKTIAHLLDHGATVRGYDPKALAAASHFIPEHASLTYHADLTEAAKDVDVIIALIEWPEITQFDFSQLRTDQDQWFIDARNQFESSQVEAWGFSTLELVDDRTHCLNHRWDWICWFPPGRGLTGRRDYATRYDCH